MSAPLRQPGRAALPTVLVVLKNVATLAALMLVLPINATLVLAALAFLIVRRCLDVPLGRRQSLSPKAILISGGKMTKALQLARSFYGAGHRVVLVESERYWLTGHRFSHAVDRFYTVPKPDAPGYAAALLAIVQQERIDLYVPVCSPVASLHDSEAMPLLAAHCEVMHVEPSRIGQLDDKYRFFEAARALNLAVPKSFLITDAAQVLQYDFSEETRPYILKSIAYDSVRRLDLTKLPCESTEATATFVHSLPISKSNPWILQEFISGQEYCTHGTIRDGELRVHCCCESSAFQINYANVVKPEIESWIRHFAAGTALTGQASFDFIEADDDGKVYAIECNPRTHSAITMFYDQPALADAYLGHAKLDAPVVPTIASRPTYWIYHELWRLVTHLSSRAETLARLKVIFAGKDAVFDWRDPLPFLMLHHWHVPLLLLRDLRERRGWIRIDFNIGKLVQLGGD